MAALRTHKVVSALPSILEPDALYFVRAGEGFDLYITNHAGTIISYTANYQPKNANLSALAAHPAPVTPGNLFALDPLAGWQSIGPGGSSGAALPELTTENATFQDEGTSTAGWTATDMTMAVNGSILRATKTNAAGAGAQITKPVTLPAGGKDYILYVRMRSNVGCVCWLANAADGASVTRTNTLWLNAINSGAPSSGSLSVTGYTSDGAGKNLTFAEGFDTATNWVDAALHFDSKFKTLSVYLRRADGSLDYKGRVAHDFVAMPALTFRTLSGAAAGSWIEFDFVQVCAPNLVVVGDSIAEGKNGFSPNMSLGLNNYLTTWMNYARAYLGLRNNLIVGKGVGSERSEQTAARTADYAGIGAKLVFVHASSNDTAANTTLAARTSNTQAIIDAVKASEAKAVLLNAMYGTAVNGLNPGYRDYLHDWWTNYRLTLTKVDQYIDIMQPIRTTDNFMRADLTESDAIHPKAEGDRLIGQWIASNARPQLLSPDDKAKLDTVAATYQTLGTAAYKPLQTGPHVRSDNGSTVALAGAFGFGGGPKQLGSNASLAALLGDFGISKVLRVEDGIAGMYAYAPILHMGGIDTWWQLQVAYSTGAIRVGYGIGETRNGVIQVITNISEEFGTNANGDFWRFTDGRLEMYRSVMISAAANAYGEANVQMPASRSGAYRAVVEAVVAGPGTNESYDQLKLQVDFLTADTLKLRWKFSVAQNYTIWLSVKGRWK